MMLQIVMPTLPTREKITGFDFNTVDYWSTSQPGHNILFKYGTNTYSFTVKRVARGSERKARNSCYTNKVTERDNRISAVTRQTGSGAKKSTCTDGSD